MSCRCRKAANLEWGIVNGEPTARVRRFFIRHSPFAILLPPRELDTPHATRHSARMKTKGDVVYLTEKEWNAFKEQEHQERLAHRARVTSGELTAAEANREASIFAHVPSIAEVPLNFDHILRNARSIRLAPKKHGGRKSKTVRA